MSIRLLIPASLLIVGLTACSRSREPAPSSEVYREAVTAFYVGVSAMQTTQEVLARQKLDRVVALVPEEPAGWANLGLLLLRQQDLDQGTQQLARAATLAPDSPEIHRLQALAESRRGNLAEATRHWRRALDLDPSDLEAAYALALETERQGGPDNEAAAERLLAQLVARSGNLAARLEYARVAAKRGDQAGLTAAIAPLAEASRAWSPDAQPQLQDLQAAATNPRAAATKVTFLKKLTAPRAGLPRRARRGQHPGIRNRPAAAAVPALEEPGSRTCARRFGADLRRRSRRRCFARRVMDRGGLPDW